jgi:hypothetical protein
MLTEYAEGSAEFLLKVNECNNSPKVLWLPLQLKFSRIDPPGNSSVIIDEV